MSKDYKLGILFGLVVLGAGVIYWVALDKSGTESTEQPQDEAPTVQLVGDDVPDVIEEPTVIETVVVEEVVVSDDVAPVEGAPTPAIDDTTTPDETPLPDSSVVVIGGNFQIDPNADSIVNADDPIIDPTPIPVPQRVDLKGKKTYTVRAGDNGFSVVSKRVYDTPKHWKLIRDANPGVLSTALRPGMVLKIPPLPDQDITLNSTPPVDHGKTSTNATGQKVYVVASDDVSGFWGISEKVYGKGKGHLYPLIRDANPKIDTTKLRAGMKLIIPSPESVKPIVPVTRASNNGNRTGQIVTIDGKRYYIVKAGDAGFGYIARKVYGSTKYAYLISRANPNANTATLMPRDKLLLPPKPVGQAPPATRTRTTRPATNGSPRPYFGN